jgi:hypothetical protein
LFLIVNKSNLIIISHNLHIFYLFLFSLSLLSHH